MQKVALFFDLDGVLVYECGATDFGYAFLFKLLLDEQFDPIAGLELMEVDQRYLDMVKDIRPSIKGKHCVQKIHVLYDILHVSDAIKRKYTPEYLVRLQIQAQRKFIIQHFPPEDYIIEKGMRLFQRLRQRRDVFISTLTANEEGYTAWLLGYIGASFDYVLAFSYTHPEISDKVVLLQQFLRDRSFEKLVVIGDGPMDMKAGAAVGAHTIGVAWSQASRRVLEKTGCSYISDGLDADGIFSSIQRFISE